MKLAEIAAIGLAATVAFGLVGPAFAAAEGCPTGQIAIVRLSKIKPGGSMAGVEKAAADHAQWYHDHGYATDRITFAPVITYDPAKMEMVRVPDSFMTFHTHGSHVPAAQHDAAWAAYVAEYSANSDIVTETMVCMPD